MDLNKYLNNVAPSEPQYSKEEYAAMKKTEREAVWVQVDARMGEVLADAPALQEFLNFMSQCRNSLPNQLLLSGQNADITDARTFQQWKDAGRHIRTGEEGYTAIVGQVYENNGRKASGYNIGKVFDITQTRGRPVPPPANYQVDELVAAAIESSPVPIQISDSLPDGIQAQYVPKNRTIYVRNGMDLVHPRGVSGGGLQIQSAQASQHPLHRGRRRSPLRLHRRRQRAGRSARCTRKLRTAGYGRFSARRSRRNEANHTKNQEAQMKLNQNKKSVKISLNLFALYAVMVCGVVFALPAFAADDPLVVVENLSTFIFSLIRAVGLILLGWGIVQVGLSLQSHDPSQRSQGFLTLAGGLVITFAKEILDLITA